MLFHSLDDMAFVENSPVPGKWKTANFSADRMAIISESVGGVFRK